MNRVFSCIVHFRMNFKTLSGYEIRSWRWNQSVTLILRQKRKRELMTLTLQLNCKLLLHFTKTENFEYIFWSYDVRLYVLICTGRKAGGKEVANKYSSGLTFDANAMRTSWTIHSIAVAITLTVTNYYWHRAQY